MQTTRTADAMTTTAAAMQYKADWELREMLDEVENSLSILRTQMQRAADTHNQTWYTAIQRQMAPLDDQRRELKAALASDRQPAPKATKTTARQVERERAVWHSLRHEGTARYSDLVEVFSVASTSHPGARYTITHDTVTGAVVCNCPAGTHGRNCLHAQAVTRYLTNRAAAINNAADEAVRARQAADDRQRDTAPLRRSNRAFSLMK